MFLGLERLEALLQVVEPLVQHGVGPIGRDRAACFERASPNLPDRRLRGDLAVHHRLRERRLVAFVMPVPPVADQVDEEIALELFAIAERQPGRGDAGLRIVGVDVHDRNLERARQPARVERAVGIVRRGRKPDLVVRDDVDGAARRIAVQPVQVQGLGDDTLT